MKGVPKPKIGKHDERLPTNERRRPRRKGDRDVDVHVSSPQNHEIPPFSSFSAQEDDVALETVDRHTHNPTKTPAARCASLIDRAVQGDRARTRPRSIATTAPCSRARERRTRPRLLARGFRCQRFDAAPFLRRSITRCSADELSTCSFRAARRVLLRTLLPSALTPAVAFATA